MAIKNLTESKCVNEEVGRRLDGVFSSTVNRILSPEAHLHQTRYAAKAPVRVRLEINSNISNALNRIIDSTDQTPKVFLSINP